MDFSGPDIAGNSAESAERSPGLTEPVTALHVTAATVTTTAMGAGANAVATTVEPAAEAAPPAPSGRNELAICCSGGGIRSASYCLGAIQALEQAKVMSRVRSIFCVSGGSYIASARTLVAHDLLGKKASEPAYAPGSPEERNLRNNTHYLAPNAAVVLTGVLSLLLGSAVTFLLVFAPLYAFAHAWGWLLRWQGILAPSMRHPHSASFPAWAVALPIAAGAITLGLFLVWWLTLARRTATPGAGSGNATWVGRPALVTVILAAVLLLLPLADAWLFGLDPHSTFGRIVHFFGFGQHLSWSPGALAGLIAAIMAVARFCQTGLAKWHALASSQAVASSAGQSAGPRPGSVNGAAGAGPAASPGLLTRAGMWARQKLQPWIGSAVVVLIVLVAILLWTGDGAQAGFGRGQLTAALIAAAVGLVTSVFCDVNRTSMHDFYRWRLANAYAVTRDAVRGHDLTARRRAAATRLSELKGPGLPELVICATANINAARMAPRGQGGRCLTFDPDWVSLRHEAFSALPAPWRARTADYEALAGHDRFTLFDLSAISGAAVSPLMGSATRQAYRILFTAANVRLGVWLPHPRVVARAAELARGEVKDSPDAWWARRPLLLLLWYRAWHPLWARHGWRNDAREARLWAHVLEVRAGVGSGKPHPYRGAIWYRAMQPSLGLLWGEAVGHLSYRSTWMYVTDGGHYDNLGLVEALRRGAENVVVLDASGDKATTWFTLGTAIALARADAGVEIKLDPASMTRGRPLRVGEVVRPWAEGTFTRPAAAAVPPPSGEAADLSPGAEAAGLSCQGEAAGLPRQGNILVCKLGWWRGAPWDVQAYAAHHPTYPGDSTIEQLYDGAEFEAYRALGAAAVETAVVNDPTALALHPVR
jgi:hypothetical protein